MLVAHPSKNRLIANFVFSSQNVARKKGAKLPFPVKKSKINNLETTLHRMSWGLALHPETICTG